MQATRIALRSSSSFGGIFQGNTGQPKLLLPALTYWQQVCDAYSGAWSLFVDDDCRNEFKKATTNNVIQEQVLQNSTSGAMITFALFHNLQNPLWAKYQVDPKDFVDAVGPALENFHDTLGCLRNELATMDLEAEKEQMDEKLKQSDQELLSQSNLTEALLGTNLWTQQAEEDDDSLAGRLAKMTTSVCFDAFYYTSKLETLGGMNTLIPSNYVPGSVQVNQVALLHAKVMEILPDDTGEKYDELKINELNKKDELPVAAQLDVLYEVTHTYQEQPQPKETSKDENKDDATQEDDKKSETFSYTNLVVAVFEGWLHGDPSSDTTANELRWKVAMVREAFEFPYAPPSIKQQS